jgi:uncharacterized membrane protein YheB (UPF0754 family)
MVFSTVAHPLIGAVIGYCTNYIAVKMLFRPLRPITVFGHSLPFTPGIIPKGQGRLAHAVGTVVGQELLTQEELERSLLSEEIDEKIRSSVAKLLQEQSQNETELGSLLTTALGEENYQLERETLYRDLTDHLAEKLGEMDLGRIIAEQVVAAVKEKVRGTLLAMMVNEEMLDGFAQPVASQINQYVRENGDMILSPAVCEEMDTIEHHTVGSIIQRINDSTLDLANLAVALYHSLVHSHLADILSAMDLAGVAERRIVSMQPEELEALVLSVMKKELNAVVNLGALVGFLLGLLNLLF